MTTIRTDAGIFPGARIFPGTRIFPRAGPLDPVPSRAARPVGTTSWRRIAGLTLIAILGLFFGIVAGVLIVVSSGLVAFC